MKADDLQESRTLAILLFDDVEVLDFCGPFEVFSVAADHGDPPGFRVFTVSQRRTVRARHGLTVQSDYELGSAPQPQILLVPGGQGTRQEMHNEVVVDWVRTTAECAELVLSVCTGALLLGKAGLLSELECTTHQGALRLLQETVPTAHVLGDRRFVDTGRVVTSGGIAAGIDMSLHIVDRLLGRELANVTAQHMEYPWSGGAP